MLRKNMGLYRGKRRDTGEWVEGYLAGYDLICPGEPQDVSHATGKYYDETPYVGFVEVDPATVGRFTGMRDRNGERVFEGDVCRFREWSRGEMCWIGNIHYENQQFVISGGPNEECDTPFCLQLSRFVAGNIEVIGTFHDNHELLEVTPNE